MASPFVALPAKTKKGTLHSSGTASDSICPKGWRLPEYEKEGSYLELLKPYSNRSKDINDMVQIDTILQLTPLALLRSGRCGYDSGQPDNQYYYRFYWSSYFASAANYSSSLVFNSKTIMLQNGRERGHGFSLRCLAR